MANMGMIAYGYKMTVSLLRDTLEQCDTYECAVNKIANETIVTMGYFIVAGTKGNEGVVISKDRIGFANIANLTDTQWYLVQTNDDHFTGVCRERCTAARANFDKLTQAALTVQSAYDTVLMVEPNLNFGTIYAVKMSPSSGRFDVARATGTYKPSDM